jgi:SM-20-related protein
VTFIAINPELDVAALAARFRRDGSVQIHDFLVPDAASRLRHLLQHQTPWGLAWQAGSDGPHLLRHETLSSLAAADAAQIQEKLVAAMQDGRYAFAYSSYPLVQAYLERWAPGSDHERLLEEINAGPLIDLVQRITGVNDLIKADGQATLYAPGHFLARHDDDEPSRGRRIAYVLGLTMDEWRPEWGGYLNFYDPAGQVQLGMRPRFNTLSLFTVPQDHAVEQVASFAPTGRFAVTGWFRNR